MPYRTTPHHSAHYHTISCQYIDFPKSFPDPSMGASLPLWKGFLSLAARQISPVDFSPGDVIVYIEGRSGLHLQYWSLSKESKNIIISSGFFVEQMCIIEANRVNNVNTIL